MQPSRNDRPFAELDALYMGILSFVKDVKATLRLLGVLILCNLSLKTPKEVGEFIFLDPGEVECLLLDLASVVECLDMDTEIRILHASFPDFLFDWSRSGEYYIDNSMIHGEIAQLCLSHIEVHKSGACVKCTFLASFTDYSSRIDKFDRSSRILLSTIALRTCFYHWTPIQDRALWWSSRSSTQHMLYHSSD